MGGVEFIGKVVSNRMQKTVVVAVSYAVWIPKYKVYQKRISRHKARDQDQSCVIGDIVRIRKSRRFSRHCSYSVMERLREANVFDQKRAEALAAHRDASRPPDAVTAAQQRLQEVEARLAKLRDMYQREMGSASITGSLLTNTAQAGASAAKPQQQAAGTAAAAAAKADAPAKSA